MKLKRQQESEVIAELISALRTAHVEMLTLVPRLSGPYQRNISEACTRAKIALANAEEHWPHTSTPPGRED